MSLFSYIKSFFRDFVAKRFTARVALILVTLLSAGSLMYHYFTREDAVSVLTVVGAVIVPFQESVNRVGKWIFKSEEDRRNLQEARAAAASLESENADLQQKLDDANSLILENEELRSLLNAKERLSDYDMMEAEIIGNDGINCFERFTINRGSLDGVKVDMNVINDDGLIGIVTTVGLNYSIVTSIIEDGMNVSAMTKNGHENCIVTGDMENSGSDELLLDDVLSDVDLQADGTLVTSYISDKFLPGLLIGHAEDVTMNEGNLTQSGKVKTAVDFTRLHYVMVITTMKEEQEDAK